MTELVVWLTVAEVATRLRVSKMTAYRMVHVGDIPAYRIGRGLRIAEADFNAYVASARTASAHG